MGKDLGNSRSAFSEGLFLAASLGLDLDDRPICPARGTILRPIPNPREGFRHIENLLFLSSLFGKRCTRNVKWILKLRDPETHARTASHSNTTTSVADMRECQRKCLLPSARSRVSNRDVSTKSPLKVSERVPPVQTQYSRESLAVPLAGAVSTVWMGMPIAR